MTFEIQAESSYAKKAGTVAKALGLDFRVYSYSAILADINEGVDFIQRCAEVCGTEFREQLRFALAADGNFPAPENMGNPVIGVTSYDNRIDFRKLGDFLIKTQRYPDFRANRLSPQKADPSFLNVEKGHVGVVPELSYYGLIINNGRYIGGQVAVPYVFDNSLRDLKRVCFPTGKGKADDLVVVSSAANLGVSLDEFLRRFGVSEFHFADIKK